MQSVARQTEALIGIARIKEVDEYTYMHSIATCGLMIALGRQMNFDDELRHETGMAGLLHDVGKGHSRRRPQQGRPVLRKYWIRDELTPPRGLRRPVA
jgi:HD superfamily phosphohydrolase YqeK